MNVREKYGNEYAALTPAEKEELIVEFESKRVNPAAPSTRATAQSRVKDFNSTYNQIADLVCNNAFAWLTTDVEILFRCRP